MTKTKEYVKRGKKKQKKRAKNSGCPNRYKLFVYFNYFFKANISFFFFFGGGGFYSCKILLIKAKVKEKNVRKHRKRRSVLGN